MAWLLYSCVCVCIDGGCFDFNQFIYKHTYNEFNDDDDDDMKKNKRRRQFYCYSIFFIRGTIPHTSKIFYTHKHTHTNEEKL